MPSSFLTVHTIGGTITINIGNIEHFEKGADDCTNVYLVGGDGVFHAVTMTYDEFCRVLMAMGHDVSSAKSLVETLSRMTR